MSQDRIEEFSAGEGALARVLRQTVPAFEPPERMEAGFLQALAAFPDRDSVSETLLFETPAQQAPAFDSTAAAAQTAQVSRQAAVLRQMQGGNAMEKVIGDRVTEATEAWLKRHRDPAARLDPNRTSKPAQRAGHARGWLPWGGAALVSCLGAGAVIWQWPAPTPSVFQTRSVDPAYRETIATAPSVATPGVATPDEPSPPPPAEAADVESKPAHAARAQGREAEPLAPPAAAPSAETLTSLPAPSEHTQDQTEPRSQESAGSDHAAVTASLAWAAPKAARASRAKSMGRPSAAPAVVYESVYSIEQPAETVVADLAERLDDFDGRIVLRVADAEQVDVQAWTGAFRAVLLDRFADRFAGRDEPSVVVRTVDYLPAQRVVVSLESR